MASESTPKSFSVQCPNCKRKLKIDDRNLLGKKVKCPGCKVPFVLELPKPKRQVPQVEEEVKLELVTDAPPVGTSAKWVPDAPVVTPVASQQQVASQPQSEPALPNFSEPVESSAPVITPDAPESSSSELNRLRSRRKKSWGPTIIVGVFLLLGVGTVGYLVMNYESPKSSPNSESGSGSVAAEEDLDTPINENEPYSKSRLEHNKKLVDEFAPTDGKPLHLAMMPRGVTFVIHLRPALLWSDDYNYQVLKASLTDDVTNWIAAKLKEHCRREPAEIEEAYIGFILGAGGTKPEICTVVHLKVPAKMSALLDEFKGESVYDIMERPDIRLKRDDKYAYLIQDTSTIAIAPRLYATELEESQTQPFILSVPMENLLRETDQDRLITMFGLVRDLRLHYEAIMPESSQPAVAQILNWIGEDVEVVSWSAHPEPYFHSELKMHPISGSNPPQVNKRIQAQLEELPESLWKNVCLKMSPRELRFRNFIGRLPAMLEAYQQSTVTTTTANYVSMTTVLPAKAAPNLALATLFTANEAARTDFSTPVIVATTDKPKLPETVVGRLRIPVDAEFSATPLEQAFQYLSDEIQVTLKVDGDALKDAGYTKNMSQTFNLGMVSAEKAFAQIINRYQEKGKIMVMSIDEKTKTIHVLTEKFAKQKNMPIYKLKTE